MQIPISAEMGMAYFGVIEIVKVPEKEGIPLEFREPWLGIQMSYLYSDKLNILPSIYCNLPSCSHEAYIVVAGYALKALETKSTLSADYWRKTVGLKDLNALLSFSAEEVKVIKISAFNSSDFVRTVPPKIPLP